MKITKSSCVDWGKIKFDCWCGSGPRWAQIPYDAWQWCRELIFPTSGDNWAWKIRYRLNPRQKWIKKYITYFSYSDKTELVREFLFGCVQDFIDPSGEDCFGRVNWEGSSPECGKFEEEIRQCHYYINVERPTLQNRIDEALSRASEKRGPIEWIDVEHNGIPMKEMVKSDIPYEEIYGESNELEKKLDELDTKWLVWIAQNRGFMWT